jgi:Tfp pilus assembly protein PilN
MRPLEINLATRPFRNNTLYWVGFGSAGLALAVLSVVNVWMFFGYGNTMRQHREDLSTKQSKQAELARDEQRLSLKLTKLDFKGLAQQSEFANDAIRKRTFSWTRLFNRLEEVVPPSVMMMAIRPEIQSDGISIVAEGAAKDQEGLLKFEENLIGNRHFSRIYPGSERREQKGQDLRFSLKFDYVPEGRSEAGVAPEPVGPNRPPEPPPKVEPPTSASGQGGAPAGGAASKAPPPPGKTAVAAAIPPAPAPVPSPPQASAAAPPAPQPSPSATPAQPPASTTPAPGPAKASDSHPTASQPQVGMPRGAFHPMKPGAGRKRGEPVTFGPAARKRAAEEEAARFNDQPLQAVIDYLMKYRSMTFVFAGDFDLRQKVTFDLNGVEEDEVVTMLSSILDCTVTREGVHAYRLSPKSGGEPLEEPPVDEEPAPPADGGDSGQEPPP